MFVKNVVVWAGQIYHMKQVYHMLLSLCWLASNWSCQNAPPVSEPLEEEQPLVGEMAVQDTLRLQEGRLPEQWIKVDLGDGYYIGFPKKPRRQHSRSQKRTEYMLKRNKYRFHMAVTELGDLPSFKAHNAYRSAYYQAVLEDLAEAIDADIQTPTPFYSQGIYEGLRATLLTEDVRLYVQCLMIETRLYTATCLIYDADKPAYWQLRDRFFYSFGNEFYNDPGNSPTTVDTTTF